MSIKSIAMGLLSLEEIKPGGVLSSGITQIMLLLLQVLRAGSANLVLSPQHAEAIACMKGLEHAVGPGMRRIMLETDAASIANALSEPDVDRSILARHTVRRDQRFNV